MPITYVKPELGTNEALKTFEDVDSLATAYLDQNTRVTSGSLDLLPEDMRKDPAITRYKNVSELARGLVETQKMVGSIEKAPEKPDGYKWTPMTGLHAKLKAEEITKELMPLAHAAGVGNKAADILQQGLLKTLSAKLVQQEQARKDAMAKSETELRTEWGAEYDARFDKIVKTMTLIGGPEMVGETVGISAALKGSPKFLKGMGKLISLISEDSLKGLGETGDKPITDATAAKKEIDKYMQEISSTGSSHAYWNEKDPKHEDALKKMHDLHALLGAK
jgi:hypothetical protein